MSCRPLDVESFRNRARLPKGITRRKRGGYDESKKVSRTLLIPHSKMAARTLTNAAAERGTSVGRTAGRFIVRSLGRFFLRRVLNLGCNSVLMGDLGRGSLLPGVNSFLDVLLELLQVEFLGSFPGDQFGLVGHLDLDLLVGVFRNHDDQLGISIDLDDRAH